MAMTSPSQEETLRMVQKEMDLFRQQQQQQQQLANAAITTGGSIGSGGDNSSTGGGGGGGGGEPQEEVGAKKSKKSKKSKDKKEKKDKKSKKSSSKGNKEHQNKATSSGSSHYNDGNRQTAGEQLDETKRSRGGLLDDDEQNNDWNMNRRSVHDPPEGNVANMQQGQPDFFADFGRHRGDADASNHHHHQQHPSNSSAAPSATGASSFMAKPVQAHVDLDDAQSFGGFIIDETRRQDMGLYQQETKRRASMDMGPYNSSPPPPDHGPPTVISGGNSRGSKSRSPSNSRSSEGDQSGSTPVTRGQGGFDHHAQHQQQQLGGGEGNHHYGSNHGRGYYGGDGDGYAPQNGHHHHHQQQFHPNPREHHPHDYSDSCTIHSDITGLTGAFSSMPGSRAGPPHHHSGHYPEEELTDEEPEVAPLGYPKYDPNISKFAEQQRMERKQKWRGVQRAVQFSSVEVRHYERIIGDNPSTVSGPPIAIGWKYRQEPAMTVDEWESRQHSIKGFLKSNELILNREERENMLLELGYSQKEIATAVRNGIRDKNRRRQTVQNLQSQGMEEGMETIKGGVKRMLGFRKKDVMPPTAASGKR